MKLYVSELVSFTYDRHSHSTAMNTQKSL